MMRKTRTKHAKNVTKPLIKLVLWGVALQLMLLMFLQVTLAWFSLSTRPETGMGFGLTIDLKKPTVTVTNADDYTAWQAFDAGVPALRISAADTSGISTVMWMVGEQTGTVAPDQNGAYILPLNDKITANGVHDVTVTAVDNSGNAVTQTLSVKRDDARPVITVTPIADEHSTPEDWENNTSTLTKTFRFTVTGEPSGVRSVVVKKVQGDTQTVITPTVVDAEGHIYTVTSSAPSDYLIEATKNSVDSDGTPLWNTYAVAVRGFDMTPPVITAEHNNPPGSVIDEPMVHLAQDATVILRSNEALDPDRCTVTVTRNGVACPSITPVFSAAGVAMIPVIAADTGEGVYVITATATDPSGNTCEPMVVTVVRDSTPVTNNLGLLKGYTAHNTWAADGNIHFVGTTAEGATSFTAAVTANSTQHFGWYFADYADIQANPWLIVELDNVGDAEVGPLVTAGSRWVRGDAVNMTYGADFVRANALSNGVLCVNVWECLLEQSGGVPADQSGVWVCLYLQGVAEDATTKQPLQIRKAYLSNRAFPGPNYPTVSADTYAHFNGTWKNTQGTFDVSYITTGGATEQLEYSVVKVPYGQAASETLSGTFVPYGEAYTSALGNETRTYSIPQSELFTEDGIYAVFFRVVDKNTGRHSAETAVYPFYDATAPTTVRAPFANTATHVGGLSTTYPGGLYNAVTMYVGEYADQSLSYGSPLTYFYQTTAAGATPDPNGWLAYDVQMGVSFTTDFDGLVHFMIRDAAGNVRSISTARFLVRPAAPNSFTVDAYREVDGLYDPMTPGLIGSAAYFGPSGSSNKGYLEGSTVTQPGGNVLVIGADAATQAVWTFGADRGMLDVMSVLQTDMSTWRYLYYKTDGNAAKISFAYCYQTYDAAREIPLSTAAGVHGADLYALYRAAGFTEDITLPGYHLYILVDAQSVDTIMDYMFLSASSGVIHSNGGSKDIDLPKADNVIFTFAPSAGSSPIDYYEYGLYDAASGTYIWRELTSSETELFKLIVSDAGVPQAVPQSTVYDYYVTFRAVSQTGVRSAHTQIYHIRRNATAPYPATR